jgi:hypothetical protein
MDWKIFAQLLVTFVVAALGWWAAHVLTTPRDLANERRKLRVSYLLEAYRALEGAVYTPEPENKKARLQSAIADIQLLGSSEFALQMGKSNEAPADELLSNLRPSLRNELELENVDQKIVFMRFQK